MTVTLTAYPLLLRISSNPAFNRDDSNLSHPSTETSSLLLPPLRTRLDCLPVEPLSGAEARSLFWLNFRSRPKILAESTKRPCRLLTVGHVLAVQLRRHPLAAILNETQPRSRGDQLSRKKRRRTPERCTTCTRPVQGQPRPGEATGFWVAQGNSLDMLTRRMMGQTMMVVPSTKANLR